MEFIRFGTIFALMKNIKINYLEVVLLMKRYEMLTQEDVLQIHETSMKILEEVGVVFDYEPALEILKKHGAMVEGKTVFFSRKFVEEKLKTVPESFSIQARNPKKNVLIDTKHAVYAGPYGTPYIRDLDHGRRISTLQDHINIAKILNTLENIDVLGFIHCEPNDVEEDKRANLMTYNNIKYNDKPFMASVLGYESAMDSIHMVATVFGGMDVIKRDPAVLSIACAITPLSYDDRMAGGLMAYAETGQPVLVSSSAIAGATAPATIAGAIAVQNAEVLAGIILTQCINPGTPVIYSASGSNADMRSGSMVIGSPEDHIFSIINGQLAKFYNIPCRMGGALSDSKTVDSQAAYESTYGMAVTEMSGGNFILHSAGIIETCNCVSMEKLIIDNEIVGMVKRLSRGIDVNEDTLAYDVIAKIGPQGEYLSDPHTFAHFKNEFYIPSITNRQNYAQWLDDGEITIEQKANAEVKRILEEYVEPELPSDIDTELKKYLL